MKRPVRNALMLAIADVGGRVIGFFITVYLARVLNPSGFGILNVGLAVLGYLMLAGSPGIQVIEARNVAAEPEPVPRRVNSVLSLRLVLAAVLLVMTMAVTAVVAFDAKETPRVIVLYAVSLLPAAMFLDWFFQGIEELVMVGYARIVNYSMYGIAVLLLVKSTDDLIWAPVAFAVGNLTASVFLLTQYQVRFGVFTFEWDPATWKAVLAQNLPVGIGAFFGQSFMNLPALVLAYVGSIVEVGVFSAAMKVVFMLLIVDRIFNALFLPAATRYAVRGRDIFEPFVRLMIKLVLVIVIPLTLVVIVAAPWAVELLFGSAYGDAAAVLRILAFYVGLTVLNSVFVVSLIGSGSERVYTRMMVIGSLITAVAVITLSYTHGTTGAGLGVVLGEFITAALMGYRAGKIASFHVIRTIAWPVIGGVAMAGTSLLLRPLGNIVALVGSLLIFFSTLSISGSLKKEEIAFLREKLL
jgi:O-antigen/teichoic acid export membrane protein